jgi:hypothetical protein
MLFFQDEKDELKQELANINRRLEDAFSSLRYHRDLIAELEEIIVVHPFKNPHGVKKDGTPRAKPGRKPKGVQA